MMLPVASSFAWSTNDDECDYSGNQSQMNACAVRDFSIADQELNRVYQQLIRTLTEQKKSELKKDQRFWLRERSNMP